MDNDKGEVQDADPPEQIKRLYDKPQEQWGVDDWRTFAYYLVNELQSANARSLKLAGVIDELIPRVKRGALHTKFLGFMERAMNAGTLNCIVRSPSKKPGAKKKMTLERAYIYREIAKRFGSNAEGARRIGAAKLRGETRNAFKLRQHVKTAANNMAIASKMVQEHQAQQPMIPGLWMALARNMFDKPGGLDFSSVVEPEQTKIGQREDPRKS